MKTFALFFMALFALAALPSCGKAPKEKNNGSHYQDYGKPGPGDGESCYVGDPKSMHMCAEGPANDQSSTRRVDAFCTQQGGQRAGGTCKQEALTGTCINMRGAGNLKLRLYNYEWKDAQAICDSQSGYLYKWY